MKMIKRVGLLLLAMSVLIVSASAYDMGISGLNAEVEILERDDIISPDTENPLVFQGERSLEKVEDASDVAPEPDVNPDGEPANGLPFTDVSEENWFYSAVTYAYENGLMVGNTDTLFLPNENVTRAMAVAVLFRLEGEPEAPNTNFSDVRPGAWYESAVNWAAQEKIVYGISDTAYAPEDFVSREQIVAILQRYIQYKGGEPNQRDNLNEYTDVSSISKYAVPSVKWAVGVHLLSGRSQRTIAPKGMLTRAELAQILRNLIQNVLDKDAVMHPDSISVPVLIYHSIDDKVQNSGTISPDDFSAIISMLSEAGYHAVTYRQLVNFVDFGAALPENPIVVSLDDGYSDNLENGYPILKEFGFCAEVSVICSFIGIEDHFDDFSALPHFSLEEVLDLEPGVIEIQSHTNRMHMPKDYPNLDDGRNGVARRALETDEEYLRRLRVDFQASYDTIAEVLNPPVALTYPYGIYTMEAEQVAKEVGYRVTVTTRNGNNVITRGNVDSLYLLNRVVATPNMTAEDFQQMMDAFQ